MVLEAKAKPSFFILRSLMTVSWYLLTCQKLSIEIEAIVLTTEIVGNKKNAMTFSLALAETLWNRICHPITALYPILTKY
jgi:hypothetical protein